MSQINSKNYKDEYSFPKPGIEIRYWIGFRNTFTLNSLQLQVNPDVTVKSAALNFKLQPFFKNFMS